MGFQPPTSAGEFTGFLINLVRPVLGETTKEFIKDTEVKTFRTSKRGSMRSLVSSYK